MPPSENKVDAQLSLGIDLGVCPDTYDTRVVVSNDACGMGSIRKGFEAHTINDTKYRFIINQQVFQAHTYMCR